MEYHEFQPKASFSQHIECFWKLTLLPEEVNQQYELLAPDCSFDIIFCEGLMQFQLVHSTEKINLPAGAVFVGQKTSGTYFSITEPQEIFGIRFKPFAFAHLFPIPPNQLTDKALPLNQVFSLDKVGRSLVQSILKTKEVEAKIVLAEQFTLTLFDELFYIDQTFRAQLNYIMNRKGILKIQDLFTEFGVSKVTLHKHFLAKMGLTPKQVSRIWRFNHFLQLQQTSQRNLTALALEAGYYDQAHFIREFKAFFRLCPRHVFQNESQLLKISQGIIDRRFSNAYDPRV